MAIKIFGEKNRGNLPQHSQDFVRSLMSDRLHAKLIEEYWLQVEVDNKYVEQFWQAKGKLQQVGDAKDISLEILDTTTQHLPKWLAENKGLRQGSCTFFETTL